MARIDLFVCHVTEDRQTAQDLVVELEKRGLRCWFAPRDIVGGQAYDDAIADALDECRAMLLVFSDRCNDSDYIRREVTVAGESGKIVIPLRIEDAKPRKGLKIRLTDLHWIDAFVERDKALDQLVTTVGNLDGPLAALPAKPLPTSDTETTNDGFSPPPLSAPRPTSPRLAALSAAVLVLSAAGGYWYWSAGSAPERTRAEARPQLGSLATAASVSQEPGPEHRASTETARRPDNRGTPGLLTTDDPTFFDRASGQPIVWYQKTSNGDIELYDAKGFHPKSGEPLLPITRDVIEEWQTKRATARAVPSKAPEPVDPKTYPFFDQITGAPRIWYWKDTEGRYSFFDAPGFHPTVGEPLMVADKAFVMDFKREQEEREARAKAEAEAKLARERQEAEQRAEAERRAENEKRIAAEEQRRQTEAAEQARREQARREQEEREARAKAEAEAKLARERLEAQQRAEAERRADEEKRRVAEEQRRQIEAAERARREQAKREQEEREARAKAEAEAKIARERQEAEQRAEAERRAAEEKRRVAEEQRRSEEERRRQAEAAERTRREQAEREAEQRRREAEAREAERRAGDRCDELAGNPTDQRGNGRGVPYEILKLQTREAIDACTKAVELNPAEARYQYQLARATQMIDKPRAFEMQKRVAAKRYPAAFDNLGWLYISLAKSKDEAVRQFKVGVQLGDPDCMMSLAEMIDQKAYLPSDPLREKIALYKQAAALGHPSAQRALEIEMANYQRQQQDLLNQQQMQQQMLGLFGAALMGAMSGR
ncbi:TIR domain-containing protein [Methyloraptor flagellatus]|uniref:TIR domain-containing protein n=1 Tax=Methyloraptor flagellatus TaxID=3162530 RepID=A0AAU7XDI0_9HYPH